MYPILLSSSEHSCKVYRLMIDTTLLYMPAHPIYSVAIYSVAIYMSSLNGYTYLIVTQTLVQLAILPGISSVVKNLSHILKYLQDRQ